MVAVHQPNFFPWMSYFNKVARADLFVLMDNVQYSETSRGTWMNRVRLLINRESAWATMPVDRSYSGTRLVHEMRIDQKSPWRKKLLRTIQMNYARAPFYGEVIPVVTELIENPTDLLADYNEHAIRQILRHLSIPDDKVVRGSTREAEGQGTEILISIVKGWGGTAYMCGAGAGGYQQDERFAEEGLGLVYQAFRQPEYPQVNAKEFVPGLSILDALMNCGWSGTRELVMTPPAAPAGPTGEDE